MQSPIPALNSDVCPRCGARVGEVQADYCPSCGALLQPARKSVLVLKIIGAICLGLLALALAGVGACLLLLGGLGAAGSGGAGEMLAAAVTCLVLALLMLAGIIFLVMKR
jgi:hypothetical protein